MLKSGINLHMSSDDVKLNGRYFRAGSEYYQKNINDYARRLNNLPYIDYQVTKLNANMIMSEWFPKIDANVFISHSHRDVDLAKCVAGMLLEYGRQPFIDSCFWGYMLDLQKQIDDKFAKLGDLYDYDIRNQTTAHVHLMVANSLLKTISRCEEIIFINTHESVIRDSTEKEDVTESPWLYSELNFAKVLLETTNLNKSIQASESVTMQYHVNLDFLDEKYFRDLEYYYSKKYGMASYGIG